jgi:hypothetical protein
MAVYARIISVFLALVFVISLSGCYPTLKKEASRPEEALIPVRFCPPTFQDDMDFESLKMALERNLVYLNRIDQQAIYQYGPHKFTCKQVRVSQEAFLKLISENHDWKLFWRIIRAACFLFCKRQ